MAFYRTGALDTPLLPVLTGVHRRQRYTEIADIVELLREALAHDPSDIHINSGEPVLLEIHGTLHRITEHVMEWTEFENIARVLRDKEGATTLLSQGQDYDDSFTMTDHKGVRRRLRVNMTPTKSIRSNQSASLILRPMMDKPPLPHEIGLSPELLAKCYPRNGAVYVIGPTGSGKTTLFGSLIRHAAETGCAWSGHLATYESPTEFDLSGLTSRHLLITQCSINTTWGLPTFAGGARNAMRRHPCAVLIGEVRDYETVVSTVELALTGHPVLATAHAANPAVAFQRLVTRYPFEQQRAGLYDLIMTTQLFLAQLLIPSTDGKRVAIREWVAFDDSTRQDFLRLDGPGAVVGAINEMVRGSKNTFRAEVTALLSAGRVTEQVAMQFF